jgi:multidrug efflux pump subunit AcrA (membrane-fusion protein)
MQATIVLADPVGGIHTATVEVLDPLIDARSGTFGIRLLLPNPHNKIPAGLRCKVEFPAVSAANAPQPSSKASSERPSVNGPPAPTVLVPSNSVGMSEP